MDEEKRKWLRKMQKVVYSSFLKATRPFNQLEGHQDVCEPELRDKESVEGSSDEG